MTSSLTDEIFLTNGSINFPESPANNHLIFFITGNPGLISYYDVFLNHLYAFLATNNSFGSCRFQVYGRSLSGFEVNGEGRQISTKTHPPPYGLEEQIENVEQALQDAVRNSGTDSNPPTKVILMGHSVGAYILLEILRRHRAKAAEEDVTTSNGVSNSHSSSAMKIIGGICLFPTVTHIAHSSHGQKFDAILKIPYIASIVGFVAKALTFFFPLRLLIPLVQFVTRMPKDAATTTAAFLKSRNGVQQALHMARDELRTITDEKWDSEIWGAAHPSSTGMPRPKLFFYFGQEDHWVADRTRDDLIAARAAQSGDEEWKPVMEIDGGGVPHGFCISHSVPVAEKVAEYVASIVKAEK